MIGKILGGRYKIEEIIGNGGMAEVYKAYCTKLNRHVAIKVLKKEFSSDAEFVERFNLESQAAAGISHSNIVSVYDVGCDDGIHYIVMELVEGITLKDYINTHGMLPWRQALDFSIQICDAMAHAHREGIVHRDIKPQNIMVTSDNMLKVMDGKGYQWSAGTSKTATRTSEFVFGGNEDELLLLDLDQAVPTLGTVNKKSPNHYRYMQVRVISWR